MKNSAKQQKVTFCLISRESDNDWIQGLISYINIDKKVVEVFISSEHLKDKFSIEDKIVIKSLNNQNEFLFSGNIKKKLSSINKKAIVINIEDIKKFNDYRKNERYYVDFDASISCSEDKKNNANLVDISFGGVLLVTDGNFKENDPVNVEVLSDPGNPICFKGKILRKDHYKSIFRYGLIIEDIDDKNNSLLNELIELLQLKKNILEREWKIFRHIRYAVYSISIFMVFFIVFIVLASEGM